MVLLSGGFIDTYLIKGKAIFLNLHSVSEYVALISDLKNSFMCLKVLLFPALLVDQIKHTTSVHKLSLPCIPMHSFIVSEKEKTIFHGKRHVWGLQIFRALKIRTKCWPVWWDRQEKDSVEAKVHNWLNKKSNFRTYLLNGDILCVRGTRDKKLKIQAGNRASSKLFR